MVSDGIAAQRPETRCTVNSLSHLHIQAKMKECLKSGANKNNLRTFKWL
jgi:hypothetical protein